MLCPALILDWKGPFLKTGVLIVLLCMIYRLERTSQYFLGIAFLIFSAIYSDCKEICDLVSSIDDNSIVGIFMVVV